jgi:Fur family transcriptional regulator, peroxide stress response regulator
MERSAGETQDLMDRFHAVLKRSGLRLTPQRAEIYREVARSLDHPDAETVYRGIHARMPSVSLDTVYRSLCLFVDLGLVMGMTSPQPRSRYDANVGPHAHFVCRRCGLARDLPGRAHPALDEPEKAQEFGVVESTYIELRGLCHECSEVAQPDPQEGSD